MVVASDVAGAVCCGDPGGLGLQQHSGRRACAQIDRVAATCDLSDPGAVRIPLGLQILQHIDADLLKLVIAVFMLVYGGFFVLRRDLPNISANTPVIDA